MADQHPSFRAREQRTAVALRAAMAIADAAPMDVGIRNLSPFGCLAEVGAFIPIGSRVRLSFANGDVVHGQTRWVLAGRVGIAFLTPLRAVDMARLVDQTPDGEAGDESRTTA